MYYLELIDRFWRFKGLATIGASSIALYLYLLKIANDQNNYQFSISDVELGQRLGLNRATIKAGREKLQDFGLIEYHTVIGLPGNYRLLIHYPLEVEKSDEIQRDILTTRSCLVDQKENLPQSRADGIIEASEDDGTLNNNLDIPGFSEFLKYAQTLGAYNAEMDMLIAEKYASWLNNGWKSASGRHINNWRSSLKAILPFLLTKGQKDVMSVKNIPDIRHPKS